MVIWQFSEAVSKRLFAVNAVNLLAGIGMLLPGGAFLRGFGSQFVGWALVNWAIALFGGLSGRRRRASLPNPDAPQVLAREARNLRRLLWINSALDVGYMAGGQWLARRRASSEQMRGVGWGIVYQGAFLLIFDVIHALLTPEHDA